MNSLQTLNCSKKFSFWNGFYHFFFSYYSSQSKWENAVLAIAWNKGKSVHIKFYYFPSSNKRIYYPFLILVFILLFFFFLHLRCNGWVYVCTYKYTLRLLSILQSTVNGFPFYSPSKIYSWCLTHSLWKT